MTPSYISDHLDRIGAAVADLVQKYHLEVEALTEQQLAEAIRQAIVCGDFQRNVVARPVSDCVDPKSGEHELSITQSVIYIPGHGMDRLRELYNELIYAVKTKHDGESRHETALRCIREREAGNEGPCVEQQSTP